MTRVLHVFILTPSKARLTKSGIRLRFLPARIAVDLSVVIVIAYIFCCTVCSKQSASWEMRLCHYTHYSENTFEDNFSFFGYYSMC